MLQLRNFLNKKVECGVICAIKNSKNSKDKIQKEDFKYKLILDVEIFRGVVFENFYSGRSHRAVVESISNKSQNSFDDFQLVEKLSEITGLSIPHGTNNLNKKKIIHNTVIEVKDMKKSISDFLNLK